MLRRKLRALKDVVLLGKAVNDYLRVNLKECVNGVANL